MVLQISSEFYNIYTEGEEKEACHKICIALPSEKEKVEWSRDFQQWIKLFASSAEKPVHLLCLRPAWALGVEDGHRLWKTYF